MRVRRLPVRAGTHRGCPVTPYAAVERWELTRVPGTNIREEGLPEEPQIIHAIDRMPYHRRSGRKIETEYYAGVRTAICGAKVRVRLAVPFKIDDPDACPKCAQAAYAEATLAGNTDVPKPDTRGVRNAWTSETPRNT